MFRKPTQAEVEVAEGRRGELELVVERGGEVTIRRRDWDGKPWSIQILHANSMTIVRASQGQWSARLLPPNDYTFSVTKGLIAMYSATSWTRKVTVTPGSVHELVFPE